MVMDGSYCSCFKHVASAHSIEYNGAKPIFVDVDLNTGNIDTNLIEDKINEKLKQYVLCILLVTC